MRLPSVPGPRDVVVLVERVGEALDQVWAFAPRLTALLGEAERLVSEVHALLGRIEQTRAEADVVVGRTEETRARAAGLLSRMEPSLVSLQPTLERLAETTDPREVDALVALVDRLPLLVTQLERDVLPVMTTLGTVAPDLHDLLDISRELNLMLAKLPGMGRLKRKVDEEQDDLEGA